MGLGVLIVWIAGGIMFVIVLDRRSDDMHELFTDEQDPSRYLTIAFAVLAWPILFPMSALGLVASRFFRKDR